MHFAMATNHVILLLAAVSGFVSSSNDCDACLDGYCNSKIAILDDYQISGQLAIDKTKNIVYFHYEDDRKIDHTAAFYLNDIRLENLPKLDFSFAKAVDETKQDAYFGAARGIIKYNPVSNITIEFGLSDKIIWRMQYKNKLYFAVFKTKGLYTLEKKQSKIVPALSDYTIEDFVVDYREDIYFLSESIVYRLRKGAKQVTAVTNDIYSLSIDKFENAHFVNSANRGLYKMDWQTNEIVEVGAFGNSLPLKFVFDSDNNIIYIENNSGLYNFMPNYGRCVVSRRSHGKKPMMKMDRDGKKRQSEFIIKRL